MSAIKHYLTAALLLIAICYTSGCAVTYKQCPQPRRGDKPPAHIEDPLDEDGVPDSHANQSAQVLKKEPYFVWGLIELY